jgi:hypothetical protein
MTTQEVREMLDSTITANGKKEISGQSLNAALNAILDLVEQEGGGSGFGGSAITVLLPRDAYFEEDCLNPELIANNKACFEALKNQTEPMLIFLKPLGASKPFSQVALRLRHLYLQGEGASFFAFGYPSAYSNEHIIGGLALASDMYMIEADGTTKKIDYNGFDVHRDVLDELVGAYNHSAEDLGGATLGSLYLPNIVKDDSGCYIESLFGSNARGVRAECYYDKDTNQLIVRGGWTHPLFGDIDSDIAFNVGSMAMELTTVEETITVGGWANIKGYKLSKIQ